MNLLFMLQTQLFKHAATVGFFAVILYAACLAWQYTMVDPAVSDLHLLLLRMTFPGFQGYDALSMVWGAVLSFGYGAAASALFHSLHSDCCGSKG